MKKRELIQENEDLVLEIINLNKELKLLRAAVDDLELKKYVLSHIPWDSGSIRDAYDWLKSQPESDVIDDDTQKMLWDDLLGTLSWKFIPNESGELEFNLDVEYENLKQKYKLVKL